MLFAVNSCTGVIFFYSDGVGRSGAVSTIMSAIERVKTEHTVDVFQKTKLIRVKRPGAVTNAVRYSTLFVFRNVLKIKKKRNNGLCLTSTLLYLELVPIRRFRNE